MITIIFPDRDTERRALRVLLGRFSGRILKSGEHLVPAGALEFLAAANIPFTVLGVTTYEQHLSALRGAAGALFLVLAAVAGCNKQSGAAMGKDGFVEFRSRAGDVIVAPSQWKADEGDGWFLNAPDNRTVISIHSYPIEKVRSLQTFQYAIVEPVVQKSTANVPHPAWQKISFEGRQAWRSELEISHDNVDRVYRFYVIERGNRLHGLILHSTPEVMTANGEFFEGIILSFEPGKHSR